MIQLPNLPHDNLYKFIAFSGLAILIGVHYLYATAVLELDRTAVSIQARHETQEDRRNLEDLLVKDLRNRLDGTRDQSERANLTDRLFDLMMKSSAESTAIMNDLAGYKALKERVEEYSWIMAIGTIVGALMLVVGCRFWYVRVQRPQEDLLKSTAKSEG